MQLIEHSPPEPMDLMADREPWVDLRAVCKHLGYSRPLVTKLAHEGRIPGWQMANGKRTYWRFKLSAVDAALTGRKDGTA